MRRKKWLKLHKAFICERDLQLNRRAPLQYRRVYVMDWMTKNGANILGGADWGTKTKRQAIDKAIHEEAQELKHFA